jgi:hypothetical protein
MTYNIGNGGETVGRFKSSFINTGKWANINAPKVGPFSANFVVAD